MKPGRTRSLLLCAALVGAILFTAACQAVPATPAGQGGVWTPAPYPSATPRGDLLAGAPTPAAIDIPASTPAAPPAQPVVDPPAPTLTPPPAEPVANTSVPPTDVPPAGPVTIADTYYYRYQGSSDSGACETANCGPAVFAAAIGYAKNTWVAIKDVRQYISGNSCRGTDYNDAYRALDHWGVSYKTTNTMAELKAAVSARSHPVLVILYMGYISPGADYRKPGTDPAQHFGRFHDYTDAHMVVVKGVTEDGKWVIVDDPYVFDGGRGFYSDGTAKGHNRYFKYAEFEKAFRYFGFQGVEIIPDQPAG